MKQEVRNKVYVVVSGIAAVLVTLGLINQLQAEQGIQLVDLILTVIDGLLLLGVSGYAAVKTSPATTTTLDVGIGGIEKVILRNGAEIPVRLDKRGKMTLGPIEEDKDKGEVI